MTLKNVAVCEWDGDKSGSPQWVADGTMLIPKGFLPAAEFRAMKAKRWPYESETGYSARVMKKAVAGAYCRNCKLIAVAIYKPFLPPISKIPFKAEFETSTGVRILFDASRLALLTRNLKSWRMKARAKDAATKPVQVISDKGRIAYLMPLRPEGV